MTNNSIVFIFVCFIFLKSNGITIKIEPQVEECFSENLDFGQEIEVFWSVQQGGLLDIETKVNLLFFK